MNVYGKCLAKNCTRECQSFKPSDEDTSLCKFCDHHEQQHQLIGMVMNNTFVHIPTQIPSSTAQVAPFIAPKFASSVAESRSIFSTSARLPAAKPSTLQSKEKKMTHKEATSKNTTFPEVFVLPLDSKFVPSIETEKILLEQRGRLWRDYNFGSSDQTRIDFKLKGGVEVAKDYSSGRFYIYLFEGKKKWVPTGCSHERLLGPTEAEVESWKRDTSNKYKPVKIIITPDCWEDDELIFSGSFVDLSREPEVESTAGRSIAGAATRADAAMPSGPSGGAAVGAPPRERPTGPTEAEPTLAAHQSESSTSDTAVHRKLTEREQQARELNVPLQEQLLARYESPQERARRNMEAFEAEYGVVAAPPRRKVSTTVPSASARSTQAGESSDVGSRSSFVSASHRSASGSGQDSRASTTASVHAAPSGSSQVAAAPVKKKRKETEETEKTEEPGVTEQIQQSKPSKQSKQSKQSK